MHHILTAWYTSRYNTGMSNATTKEKTMTTLREFGTAKEAREYRHEHGTGGWIFAPDGGGRAVLFPPDMSPSDIMGHPMTRNRTGEIIGQG